MVQVYNLLNTVHKLYTLIDMVRDKTSLITQVQHKGTEGTLVSTTKIDKNILENGLECKNGPVTPTPVRQEIILNCYT